MSLNIIGIYPVDAPEPCHLIEVQIAPSNQEYDWGSVTQEVKGQPKSNWQVPWDEQELDASNGRWVFFFHYLDLSKPLITPDGPKKLPQAAVLPEYLQSIKYEEP